MIAVDDAFFEDDLDEVLVILLVLFATNRDHLIEERLEPLDIHLVIRNEAFISDNLDEAAE